MNSIFFIFLSFISIEVFSQDLGLLDRTLKDPKSLEPRVNCDRSVRTITIPEKSVDLTRESGVDPVDPLSAKYIIPSFEVSLISEDYAKELFEMLSGHREIPFLYVEDGCADRAEAMAKILEQLGIKSAKIFINGMHLIAKTDRTKEGYVSWGSHVAIVVYVKKGNQNIPMVIDPSTFNRPATVEEWKNLLVQHPSVTPNYAAGDSMAGTKFFGIDIAPLSNYMADDPWNYSRHSEPSYREKREAEDKKEVEYKLKTYLGFQLEYAKKHHLKPYLK